MIQWVPRHAKQMDDPARGRRVSTVEQGHDLPTCSERQDSSLQSGKPMAIQAGAD